MPFAGAESVEGKGLMQFVLGGTQSMAKGKKFVPWDSRASVLESDSRGWRGSSSEESHRRQGESPGQRFYEVGDRIRPTNSASVIGCATPARADIVIR